MTGLPLSRRLLAEFLGAGLLVTVVVGSGIAAQQLSPGQPGLQLLQNSTATVLGLAVLILLFGPVSGAHLNPAVSTANWALGRRTGTGLSGRDAAAYSAAQTAGAVCGCVLANVMFDLPALQRRHGHHATAAGVQQRQRRPLLHHLRRGAGQRRRKAWLPRRGRRLPRLSIPSP